MNILNYIFYRLYVQYLKKNEDATFSGIVFIGSILLFLFLPLWGFLKYVELGYFIIIYIIGIYVLTALYYLTDNRINNIILKYKNSKYNRIHWGFFYMILPLANLLAELI